MSGEPGNSWEWEEWATNRVKELEDQADDAYERGYDQGYAAGWQNGFDNAFKEFNDRH